MDSYILLVGSQKYVVHWRDPYPDTDSAQTNLDGEEPTVIHVGRRLLQVGNGNSKV